MRRTKISRNPDEHVSSFSRVKLVIATIKLHKKTEIIVWRVVCERFLKVVNCECMERVFQKLVMGTHRNEY